ncbi:MAG TPA: SDR family NAD(P)-dependent oxidoreductase [Steroidobacteraceae bacterium]|jgi:NAD(P)-dependent dehydrogenase (short-subunit alcohol dehydrogenase family)|nr:SDR family NAD(P)-dependent oxidoreductase [Steroidobacteraceae bacterium]
MAANLDGKAVLITGTGGGQGRTAALRFAAAGALVVGCDVKVDGNRETAALVRHAGGSITTMEPIDLGDPHNARRWIEDAAAQHGRIDVLYNNASAARFAPIESFPVEDWQFTVRNELDIVFYATRYAWPHLQKRGGVIINVASVAGMVGAAVGGTAHAATKGAIIAMTRQLAVEGAPHGIRVNSISPGVIESPGTAPMLADPAFRELMLAHNLIKRVGQTDDVVGLAVFLAGDDAAYITGTNMVVDGGFACW